MNNKDFKTRLKLQKNFQKNPNDKEKGLFSLTRLGTELVVQWWLGQLLGLF